MRSDGVWYAWSVGSEAPQAGSDRSLRRQPFASHLAPKFTAGASSARSGAPREHSRTLLSWIASLAPAGTGMVRGVGRLGDLVPVGEADGVSLRARCMDNLRLPLFQQKSRSYSPAILAAPWLRGCRHRSDAVDITLLALRISSSSSRICAVARSMISAGTT
jgi:hypothetical protein